LLDGGAFEKLRSYLSGEDGIEGLYRGQVRREKDALAAFAADEDMAKAIEAWVAKGKHGKLLDLWVKGLSFDWGRLYGEVKPRRISLPTYPFARERYWCRMLVWRVGPGVAAAGPQLPAASPGPAEALPSHDALDRAECLSEKQWRLSTVTFDRRRARNVVILANAEPMNWQVD